MNSWTSSFPFVPPSYWYAGVKLQQAPIETLKLNSLPVSPAFERERNRNQLRGKAERMRKRKKKSRRSRREGKKRAFCLISPIQNGVA